MKNKREEQNTRKTKDNKDAKNLKAHSVEFSGMLQFAKRCYKSNKFQDVEVTKGSQV